MRTVYNLDTFRRYIFGDCTSYQAMEKMRYYLNVKEKCDAPIQKTTSGCHLYMEHNGMTYAVRNQ